MPSLNEVCINCGATYGEHRDSDERCPPSEETIGHKSTWRETTFKSATDRYYEEESCTKRGQ